MAERKAKIAVLVSGGGTNLKALIDAQKSGIITSGEIALVISNVRSAYAITRAKDNNIPVEVITRKECGGQDAFEDKLIEILDSNNIDIIVLAGFLSILSIKFTSHFENRIINVHPALIPSFCGEGFYELKVHEAADRKSTRLNSSH